MRSILANLETFVENQMLRKNAARKGYKLFCFNSWDPVLDDALAELPEAAVCPHDLYRELLRLPGERGERLLLVEEKGVPLALAGLRGRRGPPYELVTQWLVPGFLFPVRDQAFWPVIEALGIRLHLALWRTPFTPPEADWARHVKATPTYGVDCKADFEAFWRQSSHFKSIRKARNRCKDFDFRVNAPGMRQWTIRNWGHTWGPGHGRSIEDVPARLLLSEHLERDGDFYTLSLHDGDRPIAGATLIIHDGDAVAYVNHREGVYDRHGAMVCLIDHCFAWAREKGFKHLDIGGTNAYKRHWAPELGHKYELTVNPGRQFHFLGLLSTTLTKARSIGAKLNGYLKPDRSVAE